MSSNCVPLDLLRKADERFRLIQTRYVGRFIEHGKMYGQRRGGKGHLFYAYGGKSP